ncbi:MAG: hypothetical protein H0T56_11850 [Pseudaminobacter sp.]|nr:hypothetical protein [Pseudaminobacter sp.]
MEKLADDVARLEKQLTDGEKGLRETLLESRAKKDALEAGTKKIEKLERKVSDMLSTLADREDKLERGEKAAAKLSVDRDRLESRLTILTRENKKLKAQPTAAGRVARDDAAGDALLREQLATLAAEVVNLTSKLEGPNSPIEKALAMPAANSGSGKGGEKITSLADRVRALRNA